MYLIPLEPVPNQRLSVRLENVLFVLEVKAARESMTISIWRDGNPVIQGVRCLPGVPLLPAPYLEGKNGNFFFVTEGGHPHYSRFGNTDKLWYAAAREWEEWHHG